MRKIIALCGLMMCTTFIFGQGKANTTLFYSVGVPLGNTSDYIKNVSGRGFNLYADYFIEDEFSLGFTSGVQTYYESMGLTTATEGTLTATGREYRWINQIPVLMTAKFHLARFASITPHVGLGAGWFYTVQSLELGGVLAEYKDWQFTLQPELGVGFELSPSTDFVVGACYNQGFKSKDIDAMSSVVFNVGLRFAP